MHKDYVITYFAAFAGGMAFNYFSLPLPWILGPVTALILYKMSGEQKTNSSSRLRDLGFWLLGVQIGLTFQADTWTTVGPYLLPYSLFSFTIIAISLLFACILSKQVDIDPTTTMIGSVPGGLSAMIAVSESLQGNTVLVTIFHTIRLLSVLFIIPFAATHWLNTSEANQSIPSASDATSGDYWTIFIYLLSLAAGYFLRQKIPASLIILPMLIIGVCQTAGLSLYSLPTVFFIGAQLTIGVHLGNKIVLKDVIRAGRYCGLFFSLALLLITFSFLFGLFLSKWTGMELITAILSLAPGGLVEMALTAQDAGANPAIVSSLQTIRLLTIVLFMPLLLKWLLQRQSKRPLV
ncbi:AbrB family transcriptional regulator [Halobacillus shinanisalinarum]|uniref:AbrB family transcriptional regulator n=1 Tax=Halobacillus shinanisalinarum TaxID=2932258 RepID=A0ABY4H017_9BACI|nr:AbrB family transcriptional regulator [Halobacillus shinanisalinarum]UOQ93510.1 AbrB family transcriptional regulator [Halobacillus shinanisalinarum]